MSSPVSPSDFRETIPAVNGNFCQKFLASFSLPKLVSQWMAYFMNEDRSVGTDFGADICALGCVGSGTGTGGTGVQAPSIFASDGDFPTYVRITWDAIAGATTYDVYRSSTNDSATAVKIKAGELTTLYEDSDVEDGIYYYYWVKTLTLSGVSSFSNGDRGHAGSVVTSLDTITTLDATKGFQVQGSGDISLVWEPVTGAQTYDFYKSTENDFATANQFDQNRIPYDNSESLLNGNQPYFTINGDHLVYLHNVGNGDEQFQTYYFWVIARRSDPDAVSLPSNTASGWAGGDGSGVAPIGSDTLETTDEHTVEAGITSYWIALYGAGGGGAGSSGSFGGGGGGGGAVLVGSYPVVSGAKFRLSHSPESDTSNAADSTNGSDGAVMTLEYSALGTWADTVTVAVCGLAGAGLFNGAGGGLGGAGATSTNTGLTGTHAWSGYDGLPGSGTKGGRSGCRFGRVRNRGAHFNGFSTSTYNGNGTDAIAGGSGGSGSGSYASPSVPSLGVGGKGGRGYVILDPYLQ